MHATGASGEIAQNAQGLEEILVRLYVILTGRAVAEGGPKLAGDDNLVRDPQRIEPLHFRSHPEGHNRLRGSPRTGVHDVHADLHRYPSGNWQARLADDNSLPLRTSLFRGGKGKVWNRSGFSDACQSPGGGAARRQASEKPRGRKPRGSSRRRWCRSMGNLPALLDLI